MFCISHHTHVSKVYAIHRGFSVMPHDVVCFNVVDGFFSCLAKLFVKNAQRDILAISEVVIPGIVEEMGKLASKLLFDSIETGKRLSTQIELAPNLIARDSVMNLLP